MPVLPIKQLHFFFRGTKLGPLALFQSKPESIYLRLVCLLNEKLLFCCLSPEASRVYVRVHVWDSPNDVFRSLRVKMRGDSQFMRKARISAVISVYTILRTQADRAQEQRQSTSAS